MLCIDGNNIFCVCMCLCICPFLPCGMCVHIHLHVAVKEDPVVLQAMMRASSKGFVEVSLEEFESVSELVRGRVKLVDVNSVSLWMLVL